MKRAQYFERKADSLSASCYLNSLLREWPKEKFRANEQELQLDLGFTTLRLPLVSYSRLGRHEYQNRFFREENGNSRQLNFAQLVEAVNRSFLPVSTTRALADFSRRVQESRENIRSSLEEGAERIRELYAGPLNFLRAEQGLMVGHNFHPSPKSREGFSAADLRTYTPEFGGKFPLSWYLVSPEVLTQKCAATFSDAAWLSTLAATEGLEPSASNFLPFPLHPWQEKCALVQKYRQEKKILPLKTPSHVWHPTSSVRSLYRREAPYMLKFSLSARLTNSLRHLLPREVERGGQLFDALNTTRGQEFLAAHPQFQVLGEPAYAYLRQPDGSPALETVVVCRENPFRDEAERAVLATLTQAAPLGGRNLIQRMIQRLPEESERASRRWFQAYLQTAVKPLLDAHANYGIALGAHQQNLILEFRHNLPQRAFFRDCQGTGYTELGLANFSEVASIQRSNGNILSEKMGNSLFVYYLILNSTFNVITAIASSSWVSEEELLADLRAFILQLRKANPRDPSCLEYLLHSPFLMHKGNFRCSAQSTNENTLADPLGLYQPVENPLGLPC